MQLVFVCYFSGLIGQNWAMIFAGAGHQVCLFDVDQCQIERAKSNISTTLQGYEKGGLIRGTGSAVEQASRVSFSTSLEECLKDAFYVQVCYFLFNEMLYRYI